MHSRCFYAQRPSKPFGECSTAQPDELVWSIKRKRNVRFAELVIGETYLPLDRNGQPMNFNRLLIYKRTG